MRANEFAAVIGFNISSSSFELHYPVSYLGRQIFNKILTDDKKKAQETDDDAWAISEFSFFPVRF